MQLKLSLRSKQVELALAGNTTMLVRLVKQLLGQRAKQETTDADGAPLGPMQVRVVIVPTPEAPDAVMQIDAEPTPINAEPMPVLAKPAPVPASVPAPMPAPSARVMLGEARPVERRPPPTIRGVWP